MKKRIITTILIIIDCDNIVKDRRLLHVYNWLNLESYYDFIFGNIMEVKGYYFGSVSLPSIGSCDKVVWHSVTTSTVNLRPSGVPEEGRDTESPLTWRPINTRYEVLPRFKRFHVVDTVEHTRLRYP